ncbi:major facilitator superfamily domain-containing protein [Xylaria arbuscula]|nr:major facilitator superfamily domain-containing protein [Xylaria arbuscula]
MSIIDLDISIQVIPPPEREILDDRLLHNETVVGATPLEEGIEQTYVSRSRAYGIICILCLVTFIASASTGLLTSSVPTITKDLSIPSSGSYLPLSVYGLTSGASLLLSGSVADAVGSRVIFLIGALLQSAFILGCGLARTSIQLVIFRALQGISAALCLPTATDILSNAISPGRRRNVGFACTGLGQSLGYSAGLVLGGLFVDTLGWRAGWYIASGASFSLFLLAIYLLPRGNFQRPRAFSNLCTKIDWVGVIIISVALALLAYVLVELSASSSSIRAPKNIILLATSLILFPTFAFWMHIASKQQRVVLIPNYFWKQLPFASICAMVLLSYGVLQTMELFCTLFFQNLQRASPLESSLQLLPGLIVGSIIGLSTGAFVHRLSPKYIIFVSSLLSSGASLIMAMARPEWPYWWASFPAQLLQPASADVLFCIGVITVSEVFPRDMQSLAGAVFNTAAQLGTSLGLAFTSLLSDSVMRAAELHGDQMPAALGKGYAAAFWLAFGWLFIGIPMVYGLERYDRATAAGAYDRSSVITLAPPVAPPPLQIDTSRHPALPHAPRSPSSGNRTTGPRLVSLYQYLIFVGPRIDSQTLFINYIASNRFLYTVSQAYIDARLRNTRETALKCPVGVTPTVTTTRIVRSEE